MNSSECSNATDGKNDRIGVDKKKAKSHWCHSGISFSLPQCESLDVLSFRCEKC